MYSLKYNFSNVRFQISEFLSVYCNFYITLVLYIFRATDIHKYLYYQQVTLVHK
jgi:hypothetical protein